VDSRLLLYTDGLIERRTTTLDISLDHLRDVVVETAKQPIEAMLDELMDRLLRDEDTRDDVCILGVERATGG
jgi:serine phosphatase RsbU (regulator of sigma subunit)